MWIESLELTNFKRFDHRQFSFDRHFTLVVGENGTGKSSLIAALETVLNGWVAVTRGGWPYDSVSPIRISTKSLGESLVGEYQLPLTLLANVTGVETDGPMKETDGPMKVTNGPMKVTCDRAEPGDFERAGQIAAMECFRKPASEEEILPLVASFPAYSQSVSTSRPDLNRAFGQLPQRLHGYPERGQTGNRLAEWLVRWQAITAEEGREPDIFRHTRNAILNAMPDLAGIRYSTKRADILLERQNGEQTPFSLLSDGQRRMLGIISDLARRAAVLNPQLEHPARDTPGVVLIDEIDLHLHPKWQREIMENLRRAFPKVQFIATTHSPIIISAAKGAKIIVLLEDGSTELNQGYGLDLNWIVEKLQGGDAQPDEITKVIREAEDLIEEGALEAAEAKAAELRHLQNGVSLDSQRIANTVEQLRVLAHADD
jgi:energy-coupling factor transporter ATP-binding protein EcfA2